MLNKTTRLLFIVLITFGLVSCGVILNGITGSNTLPEQSAFKATYSIGIIVDNHTELLLEGQRALSGSEAGPRVPFEQRQEIMFVQVDHDNAAKLMKAIQSDTAEILRSSGATITGSSGFDDRADPIAYFSYTYSEGPFYGVVDVWGTRGEDNQFVLISQVTESVNSGGY